MVVLPDAPTVKDVEHDLLKDKSHKRQPFKYPLISSNDMVDFSVWDHIFLTSLVGGLTIHQFETPPSMILDLGCGCGYWAIEMARKYPRCMVIGLDKRHFQPNLHRLHDMTNIASRVIWDHGDYLEKLNYDDCTFDMVRISYGALGVPEFEWQFLLEEVNRVLKPGGVFELLEDDLIFPGGRPVSKPHHQSSSPEAETSAQTFKTRSRNSLLTYDTRSSSFKPNTSSEGLTKSKSGSQDSYQYHSPIPWDDENGEDPLDHSKLLAAWQEMLNSRWLNGQLTSVVPLYLATIFQDYRALPALEILLPLSDTPVVSGRNSFRCKTDGSTLDQIIDPAPYRHLRHATVKDEPDASSIRSDKGPSHHLSASAPMHLARAVQAVKGCKEAIWEAYERLYGNDPVVQIVREHPKRNTARDQFEYAWMNWENDMADRIGMRDVVQASLGWCPPPDDPPDWRIWRDRISRQPENIRYSSVSSSSTRFDICRCVRGFVAWKRTTDEAPPVPDKAEYVSNRP